jgi:threonine dehydrogenase-like Zn-dependent dehydrogenase
VKGFAPGDRITVDVFIHCGHCYQCRTGHSNVCANREIYGKRRGAYAEYAVLPERVLCKVPAKLSMEEVALLENLGVAVHAVEHVAHDPHGGNHRLRPSESGAQALAAQASMSY